MVIMGEEEGARRVGSGSPPRLFLAPYSLLVNRQCRGPPAVEQIRRVGKRGISECQR